MGRTEDGRRRHPRPDCYSLLLFHNEQVWLNTCSGVFAQCRRPISALINTLIGSLGFCIMDATSACGVNYNHGFLPLLRIKALICDSG